MQISHHARSQARLKVKVQGIVLSCHPLAAPAAGEVTLPTGLRYRRPKAAENTRRSGKGGVTAARSAGVVPCRPTVLLPWAIHPYLWRGMSAGRGNA